MVHRIHNAVVASAALSSVALLATAALLAPAGCTVLTDDALPDDAGPESSVPPGEGGAATCDVCISQACVGPWAVCFSDDDCVAQHFCTKSTGCACAAEGGSLEASTKIAAVARCDGEKACTQCADACASSCRADAAPTRCADDAGMGDDADASTTDADAGPSDAATDADAETDAAVPTVDGCAACVTSKCLGPRDACAAGTSCAAFLTCVRACGDTACAEDCGQRLADGKAKATELSNCTLAGCRGACAL